MKKINYNIFLYEFNEYYNYVNIDNLNKEMVITPLRINIYKLGIINYEKINDVYINLNSINIDEDNHVYGNIDFINKSDNIYYNDMLDEFNFEIDINFNFNEDNYDIINVYIGGFSCLIDKTPEFSLKKRILKIKQLSDNIKKRIENE